MGLRTQVHREDTRKELRIILPSPRDLRGQRRGGPRIHDVGIRNEAQRLTALVLAKALGDIGGRIHRQAMLLGEDRLVEPRRTVGIQWVPQGERNTEVTLT